VASATEEQAAGIDDARAASLVEAVRKSLV
jgi:hypothetical protein